MSNSFADLLGDSFPFSEETDATTSLDADVFNGTGKTGVDSSRDAENTSQREKVWEVIVAAMLDVSDFPAEDYHPQLELEADFDLFPIARYAVISRIEEDLKIKLKDTEVEKAKTLADLVELALS
ncbi:hypothetical protein NXS08_01390 [Gleimia sp. 6138-11-ORH1]|uniref:acyl carrier protein n=1 Tax=Gleimia sp. 6138-11-ORH1 TaxID=2973937 RepID=UPI00216963AA|nr:hypothetical protein [Gleimia sp. 6138-11-ORH1]MCS4484146.1 hypothetical protein [Gleimia sp. 6138-11-ORH1]